MNNIDYRFYDPDMREMHSMEGYDNGKITFKITEPSVVAQNNDIFPIKDVILMQYTGYKDKNGRKIYDGDILGSNSGTRYEVKFIHGAFICCSMNNSQNCKFYLKDVNYDLNVVGCIHYTDEDMVLDYNDYYE